MALYPQNFSTHKTMKTCHVLAAEKALGRSLPKGAEVHHIDEDPKNFKNNNLVILQSHSEHMALHRRLKTKRAGGNPWTQRVCCWCHKPKDFSAFYEGRYNSACKACHRVRARDKQRTRLNTKPENFRQPYCKDTE